MGLLSIIRKIKRKEKEMRILMVGLDNSGKTTIVLKINGEDTSVISPTLGFNIKTIKYHKYSLNIWDVGGQKTIRSYWRNYFEQTDGLVWVVDSSDVRRLEDCRAELHNLLKEERLSGASLLVFANKQDIQGALKPEEITKIILGSSSVARRHILAEMGYEFEVMTADIDERSIRREKPEELVAVLAEAKADAIISKLKIADYQVKDAEPTLLITSDIVVVHEGIIREKPTSMEEAWEFLKGYSGGHVSTVGSVLVTNLKTGRKCGGIDKAEVYFHDIPKKIIENLIDEGVVFKVAGGLLLEHPLILPLVEAVVGATDSVMGLPKALTEKLIHECLSLQS